MDQQQVLLAEQVGTALQSNRGSLSFLCYRKFNCTGAVERHGTTLSPFVRWRPRNWPRRSTSCGVQSQRISPESHVHVLVETRRNSSSLIISRTPTTQFSPRSELPQLKLRGSRVECRAQDDHVLLLRRQNAEAGAEGRRLTVSTAPILLHTAR